MTRREGERWRLEWGCVPVIVFFTGFWIGATVWTLMSLGVIR